MLPIAARRPGTAAQAVPGSSDSVLEMQQAAPVSGRPALVLVGDTGFEPVTSSV